MGSAMAWMVYFAGSCSPDDLNSYVYKQDGVDQLLVHPGISGVPVCTLPRFLLQLMDRLLHTKYTTAAHLLPTPLAFQFFHAQCAQLPSRPRPLLVQTPLSLL